MTDEIFFYRSTGKYGFLSNLYLSHVWLKDKCFRSGEHAYMYGKFRNRAVAEWVMKAPKARFVSIVGHNLFPYDIVDKWGELKVPRMLSVLRSKFLHKRHPAIINNLGTSLLETGDALIIENSKTDGFWGIGKKGNGKNMLGILLMKVRDEMQKEAEKNG